MTAPMSLYAATVPRFMQQLDATLVLLDKAEAFCAERGIDPAELIQARLIDDMLPFAYQVKSVAVHSQGALEGVRAGVFRPDLAPLPDSFDEMRVRLRGALDALDGAAADEVDGLVGRTMRFEARDMRFDFAAEGFLLTFSMPNFFFHVTTTYVLLRGRGVPVGKRDYLGQVRMRG